MAKNDVMKALAVLRESGLELSEEQSAALEEFSAQAMRTAAEEVFARKVEESDDETETLSAEEWVEVAFDLAHNVSQIKGEAVGRGRGEVFEQMFRVETPNGSLKVSLTRPTE